MVRALLGRVNFDLPESAVAAETRNVVYDIVRQNTQRGIGRDLIEQQKDEIYSAAAGSAKERVKLAFLVQRIAEQEKITVTQEDALKRAQQLATTYQMPLDQFLKDLQKRNGVNELYEQVLHEKVMDLIEKNAVISAGTPDNVTFWLLCGGAGRLVFQMKTNRSCLILSGLGLGGDGANQCAGGGLCRCRIASPRRSSTTSTCGSSALRRWNPSSVWRLPTPAMTPP